MQRILPLPPIQNLLDRRAKDVGEPLLDLADSEVRNIADNRLAGQP